MTTPHLPIGVLVSGRGSNLQAIIDAIERGELLARIVLVISNNAEAYALERCRRHQVPFKVIPREDFTSRWEQAAAMIEAFRQARVELVVMAGFDHIVHPDFIATFRGRIINIHPSLLPAFGGGLHAQADALEYGVKISGCTVHFVTEEVDAGTIILQAAVSVMEDDTADTLAARILEQEHQILPQAIQLIAEGRVRVEGRRTRILKEAS